MPEMARKCYEEAAGAGNHPFFVPEALPQYLPPKCQSLFALAKLL
jgi:hypothetical protein